MAHADIKSKLTPLVRKRGGYKSCISVAVKSLDALSDDELTEEIFLRRKESIEQYLQKVISVNEDILDLFLIELIDEEDPVRVQEIEQQVTYLDEVNDKLAVIERKLKKKALPSSGASASVMPVKLPKLTCKVFSGESQDKLEFKNFLLQFKNCVEACGKLSGSNKLTYLRSYLSGYAFKVISHLSISDDNYKVALNLLEDEFLDIPFIIDESFKQLLASSPKFDPNFAGVRSYVNECRALLHELKQYKVDLLDVDSAGCKLLSHLIFSKLPASIKRELVHKVDDNYPTVVDLFEHYVDIIKTLVRTSNPRQFDKKENFKHKSTRFSGSKTQSDSNLKEPSTLENFNTSAEVKINSKGSNVNQKKSAINANANKDRKYCKFCCGFGHSMMYCSKYEKLADRQKRCTSLGLCPKCSSSKHDAQECPGKDDKLSFSCYKCKKNSHISALCPSLNDQSISTNLCVKVHHARNSCQSIFTNFCVNVHHIRNSDQPFLLPVLSFEFHGSNSSRIVRCLIDTGSQRSYLPTLIAKELRGNRDLPSAHYDVTTFLGDSKRQFGECLMYVSLPRGKKQPVAILADPDFHIQLNVSQLDVAVDNIVKEGYKLAEPSLAADGEIIPIEGLAGVDIIQFIPDLQLTTCMLGTAWKTPLGLVPFGNVIHFLHPQQVVPVNYQIESQNPNLRYDTLPVEEEVPTTLINFVMSPKKTYFSPLESIFPESAVEQGLENMFSLDSLGCQENSDISPHYDVAKIEEFKKGIVFKDNKYHISLPWKDDLVSKVPSNHKVALAVLDRVVNNLEKKGLLHSYQEVFRQQMEDGIIEKIKVEAKDFDKFVWIPHRPVIKDEANVTTKIRPVFNCSLKTNGAISLNEAAYAGVNLMGDIVKLSLYFRSNDKVMLSDIKQAFLQIMLAKEEDKNKFCFFMKEGDTLVTYRYRTIIFGFNASPFILNYVIKHHASQFQEDEFSHILKSNLYVDNLLVTSNSTEFLKQAYTETLDRMNKGGFCLRSWNTNDAELLSIMEEDGSLATHGNKYEKVLGVNYFMESDSIQLASCELDPSANTKRSILSQISKVFDPLGLLLPVTTKGKLIMKELWGLNLSWDEAVPERLQKDWSKHCSDLSKLSSIPLTRSCINLDSENSLCIFCDASKSGYGFAVYNVCDGTSQLMFAKSRVAPMKTKTLPMLELLGVFLALKCLPLILDSFPSIEFHDVIVAVDSQIVLQWLLTDSVSTKSIFTRNRLKDISVFKKDLVDKYGVVVNFKYVKSEDNPCDLITRGLTLSELDKKFSFWWNGPEWLSSYSNHWPESNLDCLSEENKQKTRPSQVSTHFNVEQQREVPLLDLQNYSDFRKLIRVSSYIFKAVSMFSKKFGDNYVDLAKLYWIKVMQRDSFAKELAYLSNPDSNEVPALVNNLDLFLDDEGILRSRGRIGKTLHYDYDVLNPILLSKDHRLTRLIVEFYHRKCKHLGLQTTLNTLRTSGFWIPRMRQVVKGILGLCMICRKYNNLAFRYPRMTNLPKHRVNFIKPFQHTGVDFTGHLWVKNESGENVKMYLLIFTCLNVRAVHIELVPDMTTHSFVLAFLRFVNIFCIPDYVYSDNAKSFVAGCQVLEQALICDEFKENFQCYNIQHIRIPLYSAWVGATWERLIRTIKGCLYKTVGRAKLNYFELLTVISDVQAAVNARPLTYRSSENNLEAITPSCFLKYSANSHLLLRQAEEGQLWDKDPPSRESFISTLSSRDEIFDHFRELWYESYLLSLREHCRDLHQRKWENKIGAGDVVLVKMPNKSRPYWLLGRVLELIVGHDNKVRSVKLKRGDGVVVHHSISHLYPLELSLTHNYRERLDDNETARSEEVEELEGEEVDLVVSRSNNTVPSEGDQNDNLNKGGARPKRAAASACKGKMRKWCAELNL